MSEEETKSLSDAQVMIISMAKAMAERKISANLAGKALAALAGNKTDLFVIGVLNGWEDPVARRDLLFAAKKEISLPEAIIAMEMDKVDFGRLREYISGESPKLQVAAEIMSILLGKITRDTDELALLHFFIDHRVEMEKTGTAAQLFSNLITLAAQKQFQAEDDDEDKVGEAEYLELLLEELSKRIRDSITQLRGEKK